MLRCNEEAGKDPWRRYNGRKEERNIKRERKKENEGGRKNFKLETLSRVPLPWNHEYR